MFMFQALSEQHYTKQIIVIFASLHLGEQNHFKLIQQ